MVSAPDPMPAETAAPDRLRLLRALERKVLWLSSWTIHHANHIRPNRDGLKVGGHQASSASVATILTALYFDILRPEDRVAVKPHASPVFHAIQYLLGRQSIENLKNFRALGGAQSYPSRTKDADDVDFSTGSVGLGAAMTSFAALVQDYLHVKNRLPEGQPRGRMVSVVGDAELDEGNVYEALLEGWKHDIRNVWWVIDYNRQSLDSTMIRPAVRPVRPAVRSDGLARRQRRSTVRCSNRPSGGPAAARCARGSTAAPTRSMRPCASKGGALARGAPDDGLTKGWREHLLADLGDERGIRALLERTGRRRPGSGS